MQYNTYIFIFLFMPICLAVYFLLNRVHEKAGKILLVLLSLAFYVFSGWVSFSIFAVSIILNYLAALLINKTGKRKKVLLAVPIIVNVGLLYYYKYFNFTVANLNSILNTSIEFRSMALPLGISFFTFQQIAYLVAVYRNEMENCDLLDYLAYITFFPKILMGPIVDPMDLISQLNNPDLKRINWDNIACGIKVFCFGLFKKMILADVFSKAVTWGYTNLEAPSAMDFVLVAVSFSFQVYFDFSGYSDMATGTALMLNITLPINFDSPYKGLSVRDYWKGWHLTLTGFLTKYIYIPLGGSRKGKLRKYLNIMIVFTISGLWHGADWTFILWGVLNGFFSVLDEMTEKIHNKIYAPLKWLLNFALWNVFALLFGAPSLWHWKQALIKVFLFESTAVSTGISDAFSLPVLRFISDYVPLLNRITGSSNVFWMLVYLLAGF